MAPSQPRAVSAGSQGTQVPAKYDRAAALAYARKYWSRICADGFIAQYPTPANGYKKLDLGTIMVHDVDSAGNHSEHALLPDGTIIPWKPLDDCSHFVSCCIGDDPNEKGGGLHVPMVEQLGAPANRPYGIVGAPKLAVWLSNFPGIQTIEIPLNDQSNIAKATPGDLIGCKDDAGKFTHFMIYLGNNKVACHTYSRCDSGGAGWNDGWDNEWNIDWARGWTVFVFP